MDVRREVLKGFVDDGRETSKAGGKVRWWLFGRWLAFLRSCVGVNMVRKGIRQRLTKRFYQAYDLIQMHFKLFNR